MTTNPTQNQLKEKLTEIVEIIMQSGYEVAMMGDPFMSPEENSKMQEEKYETLVQTGVSDILKCLTTVYEPKVREEERAKRLQYLVYCPICNDAVERVGEIEENTYECFGCQIFYELVDKELSQLPPQNQTMSNTKPQLTSSKEGLDNRFESAWDDAVGKICDDCEYWAGYVDVDEQKQKLFSFIQQEIDIAEENAFKRGANSNIRHDLLSQLPTPDKDHE